MSDESLFEFPCRFPIKAMGAAGTDLPDIVLAIVREHAPRTTSEDLRVTGSRKGRYISVTVTIEAESRAQLDAIYRALTACERVIKAL